MPREGALEAGAHDEQLRAETRGDPRGRRIEPRGRPEERSTRRAARRRGRLIEQRDDDPSLRAVDERAREGRLVGARDGDARPRAEIVHGAIERGRRDAADERQDLPVPRRLRQRELPRARVRRREHDGAPRPARVGEPGRERVVHRDERAAARLAPRCPEPVHEGERERTVRPVREVRAAETGARERPFDVAPTDAE